MDQPRQELTLEENIRQVMHTLPPPIRQYLGGGKYSVIAQNLMVAYGLHVDQGSILEREIMLLLMGIENPDEFVQSLREADLDQPTIDGITQDVNAQIFVPLRAEMQNASRVESQRPAFTQRPMPPPARVSMPVPNYAPPPRLSIPTPPPPPPSPPKPSAPISVPPPPPRVFAPPPAPKPLPRVRETPPPSVIIQANPRLPERPRQDYISKVPRYVPPHPPAPRSPINRMPPRPVAATPLPAQKPQQKPVDTDRMLEDHEEPSPSLSPAMPPRPSVAFGAGGPPPNLPGAMPPPNPAASTLPPKPVLPTQPPAPHPSSVLPYDSDPYREPVDEPSA